MAVDGDSTRPTQGGEEPAPEPSDTLPLDKGGSGRITIESIDEDNAVRGFPRIPFVLIQQKIGSGGMGEVFVGLQHPLRRTVAVKVLGKKLRGSEIEKRFIRECRNLASLNHPNIVVCFGSGYTPDGDPYMVMEHVVGMPLSRWIEEKGPVSARDALHAIADLARALWHGLETGRLTHRDVKPENVLLKHEPRPRSAAFPWQVKLVDFGLSRSDMAQESSGRLTQPGESWGTPQYMAPEQFEGFADVDHRADIYSLGCVLYYVLTGQPAFPLEKGENWKSLARRKSRGPAPDVRVHDPEIPLPVARLTQNMLESSPARRTEDYELLLQRIDEILDAFEVQELDRRRKRLRRSRRPSPRAAAGLALGGVALAALATWGILTLLRDPIEQPLDQTPSRTPLSDAARSNDEGLEPVDLGAPASNPEPAREDTVPGGGEAGDDGEVVESGADEPALQDADDEPLDRNEPTVESVAAVPIVLPPNAAPTATLGQSPSRAEPGDRIVLTAGGDDDSTVPGDLRFAWSVEPADLALDPEGLDGPRLAFRVAEIAPELLAEIRCEVRVTDAEGLVSEPAATSVVIEDAVASRPLGAEQEAIDLLASEVLDRDCAAYLSDDVFGSQLTLGSAERDCELAYDLPRGDWVVSGRLSCQQESADALSVRIEVESSEQALGGFALTGGDPPWRVIVDGAEELPRPRLLAEFEELGFAVRRSGEELVVEVTFEPEGDGLVRAGRILLSCLAGQRPRRLVLRVAGQYVFLTKLSLSGS